MKQPFNLCAALLLMLLTTWASPLMLAVLILYLTGCTTPIVRDTSSIDAQTAKCISTGRVIDLMDTLPQGPDSDRYPFFEGYPDWNLRQAKDSGKLTVSLMNPLLLALGVYGWAYLEELPLGGLDTCDVHYVPGFNWLSLKHELSHCQGYADHGIPIQTADYTDQQKAIMAKEKVTRWTDTSVYRDRQNSLPLIAARHE